MNQKQILGLKLEMAESLDLHSRGTPLLINPGVLRKRNAGQVDLACLMRKGEAKWVEMREVKANETVSFTQRTRLKKAANFIGIVLGLPVELKFSLRTNPKRLGKNRVIP